MTTSTTLPRITYLSVVENAREFGQNSMNSFPFENKTSNFC